MLIQVDPLRSIVTDIFANAGCSPEESERIARHLASANLTGHDSHGVIRVPRYISWLKSGNLRAGQTLSVISETDVFTVVDGNRGFGQSIGEQAVQLGINKAMKCGVSIVALRQSGHLGRIGDWAEMAIEAGLISIHFVNVAGSLLVAPFGGVSRRMSTNPVTIGIPLGDSEPLILDFATSRVAEGKVLVAATGGKPLPPDSLIRGDGQPTDDPKALYGDVDPARTTDVRAGDGAIRTMGEHKGSGLALICEMLAGALTGGGCAGPDKPYILNGMLSIYISPDHLDTDQVFLQEAQQYIEFFKTSKPAEPCGDVLVPGDIERQRRADRTANGIELPNDVWSAILDTARDVGVSNADTLASS
ncbi:MAG TPA: malate/lactate/ureidoglycolate dehydrogenase [Gammaproteobacteria bacterium]|nr:malate/lactate/ureidoglycolate dehydrogenase [Gammaproteobacteria bacterium]